MQNLKIFSVYDKKQEAYLNPFYRSQVGEAIREFLDAVNDDKTQFNKHPEDYSLQIIGEFNNGTGIITPKTNPQIIEEAINLKKQI